MKKHGKKLLTVVLASQLAMGSAFGVAVSAEETGGVLAGTPYKADGQYDPTVPHVIINQVYGGGLAADSSTPVTHGFIELYNPTAYEIDLAGWSLQYADRPDKVLVGETNDWKILELQGKIQPFSSFLVLANPTTSSNVKLDLTEDELADQEWDLYISNKGMKVVLLSNTTDLNTPSKVVNPWAPADGAAPVAGYVDMVGAAANNSDDINKNNIDGYETAFRYGDANGPSKQKSLRRINFIDTDNNFTDFEVVSYKDADTALIEAKKPRGAKDGSWSNAPLIDTTALPVAYAGQPYEAKIEVSGGVPPYTWSAEGLPEGLQLVNGVITGTLTGLATDTAFTVTVTDHSGTPVSVSRAFTLNVQVQQPAIDDLFSISKIAEYSVGTTNKDGGVAEIVKYNKDNNKFYLVNGSTNPPSLDIVSLGEAAGTLAKETSINVKAMAESGGFEFGDLTSVAIDKVNKRIYAAVQEKDHTKQGKILALSYDGTYITEYAAGIQPDMITVTADGKFVMTADEGEPRDGINDPEGSVTIVNIATGASQQLYFDEPAIIDDGVHIRGAVAGGQITGAGTKEDAKFDIEPEYIALSQDQKLAYVSLQDNNAIAVVDIEAAKILSVKGLGLKDHSVAGNELDLLGDGVIKQENAPFRGIYMPDGISAQAINGKTYLFTANEGDATEWPEEDTTRKNVSTVGALKGKLQSDSPAYQFLAGKTEYDALEAASDWGNDGIYLFGARSFSIWDADALLENDALAPVYDSGSDFEVITGQRVPEFYNVSNSKVKMDERSVKKGPEPEDIKTALVGSRVLAFVGLERVGGFMTYDVTTPSASQFVNYTNTREYLNADNKVNLDTDTGPEGLEFISAADSPTGLPLLLVAYEVGGKVGVYQLEVTKVALDSKQLSLKAGGAAVKLTATVEQPVESSKTAVIWSSSNEAVATVDAEGNVTPKAQGTAVITAISEDGYGVAEAAVTVTTNSSGGNGGVVVPPVNEEGGKQEGGSENSSKQEQVIEAVSKEGTATASVKAEQLKKWLDGGMEQLVVAAGKTRLTLDAAVLSTLAAAGEREISISVTESNGRDAAKELFAGEQKDLLAKVGSRPFYELKLAVGGEQLANWNDGTATIELPYASSSGEAAAAVVAYYVTADGKLNMLPNAKYDANKGTVSFTTGHFSYYAVGYNKLDYRDTSSSFAKDDITYLSAREILQGVGDNQFAPKKQLTRGDFALILARMAGASLSGTAASGFSDVSPTAYYADAVAWAVENEVVSGVSKEKFAPNAVITREQMAIMLVRFAKMQGIQLPAATSAVSFADAAEISSYAKTAIQAIAKAGIIEGKAVSGSDDRQFAPKAALTREEAAKVLAKVLQL